MSFFIFLTFTVLLVFTGAIAGDDDCLSYFTTAGYIPQFADKVKSAKLQVKWGGKDVPCGTSADLIQTLNPPTLYYDAPSCCKNITVLMFAPDTIYTPPFLLWLFLNVPADNLRKGFTAPSNGPNYPNNGYYSCSYDIPKDPTGAVTNKKHIVIFLYCPCGYIDDKYIFLPTPLTRGRFDVKAYAKKHKLGNPITGYYMISSAVNGLPGVDTGSTGNQTDALIQSVPI